MKTLAVRTGRSRSCGEVAMAFRSGSGLLVLAALVAVQGIAAAQQGSGRMPAANRIDGFRAVDVSGRELLVVVDFAYTGEHGAGAISLVACALGDDGEQSAGTTCTHVPAAAGFGRAAIEIEFEERFLPPAARERARSTSSTVEVCLYREFRQPVEGRRGDRFFCRSFPHSRSWGDVPATAPRDTTRVILPDGRLETRYADGRIKREGDGSVCWIYPDDPDEERCPLATQAIRVRLTELPPSLLGQTQLSRWFQDLGPHLLEAIRRIAADEESYDNWVAFERDRSLPERIDLRLRLLNSLMASP